jgi:hypothetical protein
VTFGPKILKRVATSVEAEASKPDDGYSSDLERGRLNERYPQSRLVKGESVAVDNPMMSQSSLYSGTYSSMPSLSQGFSSPRPGPQRPASASPSPASKAPSSAMTEYHRAVLSSLQDLASSARVIAQVMGGEKHKVAAAVRLLQSGEQGNSTSSSDSSEEEEVERPAKRGRKKPEAIREEVTISDDDESDDASERKSDPDRERVPSKSHNSPRAQRQRVRGGAAAAVAFDPSISLHNEGVSLTKEIKAATAAAAAAAGTGKRTLGTKRK